METNTRVSVLAVVCWDIRSTFNQLQWRHNKHVSVSNHHPHDCLLNRVFRRRSKKATKLRVTGLCAGNSPVTGEFPAQKASNTENVSIWWRHHVIPECKLKNCVRCQPDGRCKQCKEGHFFTNNFKQCDRKLIWSLTLSPHERHDVLTHQQIGYLFDSLCGLMTKETPQTQHYWSPVRENHRSLVYSPHKGPMVQEAFICQDIVIGHGKWSYLLQ